MGWVNLCIYWLVQAVLTYLSIAPWLSIALRHSPETPKPSSCAKQSVDLPLGKEDRWERRWQWVQLYPDTINLTQLWQFCTTTRAGAMNCSGHTVAGEVFASQPKTVPTYAFPSSTTALYHHLRTWLQRDGIERRHRPAGLKINRKEETRKKFFFLQLVFYFE